VKSYKMGDLLRSSSVTNGHFCFRLLVYPHGTSASKGKSLSAFIEAAPSVSLIPEWSFEDVRYTIVLVNHQDPSHNMVKRDTFSFTKNKIDRGWHDMCRISDLMDPDQGWLGPDNSILITGSATVSLSEESWLAMLSPQAKAQAHLASDLSSLLSTGWHADVALLVDGRVMRVHSLIIATRSPVFKQMLNSGMRESSTHTINITDMDWDVLNHLCNFMYSGMVKDSVWANDATICAMMHAASKYEVLSLLELCAEKVIELVSVDNAADWLLVSAQLNIESLKAFCVNFVVQHLSEVQTTTGWERLMQDKQMVFDLAPLLFETISPPAKKRRQEASG